MKQIRKEFRKRMLLQVLVLILIYFAATIGYDLCTGHRLTDTFSGYTLRDETVTGIEDLEYRLVGDEGVIRVEKLWLEGDRIYYTLKGLKPGETFLSVCKTGSEDALVSDLFRVDRTGTVTCAFTGNFSGCRFHMLMNVVILTLAAVSCLTSLLRFRKKMLYSYEMMFISGLLIWLICSVIIQWYAFARFELVFDYYAALQDSAYRFLLYSAPVVWAFCIALSVSNISLIRHEGYRPVNALGILLSALLMIGSIIGVAADALVTEILWNKVHLARILVSSYCSVYSLFTCLLEGAVINGLAAAKHVPPMDRDYIIILGCMIRKDGTLTPLLRGRVDRAIAHAKAQEQAGGKKPIFVPSGGRGRNECMAEGQAMKNYLLSQGIPEAQILVEDRSANTAENMMFSKQLIDERTRDAKIAYSTTNYHVFRSGIIAGQKNFAPEGMGSRTKWYFWPNAFIRECIGMAVYTKYAIAQILILLIGVFAVIESLINR